MEKKYQLEYILGTKETFRIRTAFDKKEFNFSGCRIIAIQENLEIGDNYSRPLTLSDSKKYVEVNQKALGATIPICYGLNLSNNTFLDFDEPIINKFYKE